MKTLLTSLSLLVLLSTASAAQTTSSPSGSAGNGTLTGGTDTAEGAVKAASIVPDYRLVPGDKLRVEVYRDPQLSQTLQVRPDGKITLPLANDVPAAGFTPAELRDQIVAALKPFVSNPTVTVIVIETRPSVVYVMGEVQSAGPQPLTDRLDVVQAIAMAGGFKDFAKTKNIIIRRDGEILRFNYNDAVRGRTPPMLVRPNDTIIVP